MFALAVAWAFAACSPSAGTTASPAGTYQYESRAGNITAGSTVTVSFDSGAVLVSERARLGTFDGPAIESRMNPKTYSLETYTVTHDPEGDDPSIAVTAAGAKYVMKNADPVTKKAPVPGAPSFVFGDWVSSFVELPSLEYVTKAKTINGYMPDLMRGKAVAMTYYVVEPMVPPPAAARSGDAALALAWRPRGKPVVTMWYDPATFVVDAVDLGGATAFVRER